MKLVKLDFIPIAFGFLLADGVGMIFLNMYLIGIASIIISVIGFIAWNDIAEKARQINITEHRN